jgi:hypothetical protein
MPNRSNELPGWFACGIGSEDFKKRKFSIARRYNLGMFTWGSKAATAHRTPEQRVRHREATGVLIVGLLILAITLVRYWHYIAWSAR